jgi:hypothetical protein
MIDEKEFYRRFDQIVPGTSSLEKAPETIGLEI